MTTSLLVFYCTASGVVCKDYFGLFINLFGQQLPGSTRLIIELPGSLTRANKPGLCKLILHKQTKPREGLESLPGSFYTPGSLLYASQDLTNSASWLKTAIALIMPSSSFNTVLITSRGTEDLAETRFCAITRA